jgi:hypothetical protein
MDLKHPKDLLGKGIKLYLKSGGRFYFKVTSCSNDYIYGYDEEMNNLTIAISDIDYVIGC